MGSEVFRDCEIKVHDKELIGDLVMLNIKDFNLILSMYWLFQYYAKVDCQRKIIHFKLP